MEFHRIDEPICEPLKLTKNMYEVKIVTLVTCEQDIDLDVKKITLPTKVGRPHGEPLSLAQYAAR